MAVAQYLLTFFTKCIVPPYKTKAAVHTNVQLLNMHKKVNVPVTALKMIPTHLLQPIRKRPVSFSVMHYYITIILNICQ